MKTSTTSVIEHLQENYEQALIVLSELEKTLGLEQEQASPERRKAIQTKKQLLSLLQEIIQEPTVLAHGRISSLLDVLCQEQLPEIIDYLVNLEEVPLPEIAPKGSFFAQKISTPQQARCIALLRNLAAAINENSPIWHQANSLLQNALLLYSELHTETPMDEPVNNNWTSCTLF